MNKKELLDKIKLFVLDMDGTFYLGDEIFDGSLDFLEKVKEAGKEYIFFTNNSSKTADDYIKKLEKMNCHITKKDIMTSGDVTIKYIKEKYPESKVYLLGTPTLENNFKEAGIRLTQEAPDIVVVAFDTTLTYEKLEKACNFIRNGAIYLATHLDINCPVKDGFIPDCGAMCALISLSTGKSPKYLGKPYGETLDMILQVTGYQKEQIAFVGDRLYTDIATGVKNGSNGLLVLTGETKLEEVEDSDVQPTAIFQSLKDMAGYL